ncbi:MAG TPA: hypothetical protein PLZ86_00855 [bacterium]|nr:hypothetical protein [bacterium]
MHKAPLSIVAALDDEIRVLNSKIEIDSRVHVRPALFTCGRFSEKPVLIVRSGIGRAAMKSAASYLLRNYDTSCCLHVGYCGGADPNGEPGDLIIAQEVVDSATGDRFATSKTLVSKAEALCRDRNLRARTGSLVTTDRVVEMPHEKAFVGTQHGACAIDMESADLARACKNGGVPFLVVRSVLDPLDASLPDMGDSVTEEGKTDGMALAEHMIRKPKDLLKLPHIQYLASRARNSINSFLEAWIEREGI